MEEKSIKIESSSLANSPIGDGNLVISKANVSAAITKLPTSPDPKEPGIKELLTQLKTAIEAEPSLDDKSKVKAWKQLEALAKAGENSNSKDRKDLAEDAVTMLKGIFSGLQSGATLLVEWNKLLPALTKLFGIG